MTAPGDRLGRYVVDTRIGQGGMAEVWRLLGDDGQAYALKVLTLDKEDVRERFRTEAAIMQRLDHPNVVRAIEVLDLGGELGLVMEYVPGRALDAWLVQRRDASRATRDRIARQVLEAVAYAHGFGLVHRDLKPANVLVLETPEGPVPKITDFGLAKQLGPGLAATRSGIALGTPRYMAPEQIRDAKRVDLRADVWSLGALLYELYTGQAAFHRDTLIDIFTAVITADYVDPKELGVTGPARDAIVGALKVDPAERFPDCRAMLAALFPGEAAAASAGAPPPPIGPPPPGPPPAPTLIAPEIAAPDTPPPEDLAAAAAPAPEARPAARPRRTWSRWVVAWTAALVVVVLAFGVGLSIVAAVYVAGTFAEEPPAEAPRPAPPERPRRRR